MTSLTVTDRAAITTTWLFDDQGRQSQLYTPSGDSVASTWLTTTNFIVSATSADGTVGLQVLGVLTNTAITGSDNAQVTYQQFSKKMGISDSTLHRMELGEQNVTLKTLEQISAGRLIKTRKRRGP